MEQESMFSLQELPVNPIASPEQARDWQIRVASSRLSILNTLKFFDRSGFYGKTSPVYCKLTADGILEPSSGKWQNSGMGGPTESMTLSSSEWPNNVAVSSLSAVLETGNHLQQYYLSAKACRGILRRAEESEWKVPELLRDALATMVRGGGRDLEPPCFWDGGQVSPTIDAVLHKRQTMPEKNRFPAVIVPRAFAENERNEVRYIAGDGSVVGAIASDVGAKQKNYLHDENIVRRFTPVECERLQGMPDNHTRVPWGTKSEEQCPDGLRYKAIGNAIPVPLLSWIGKRLLVVDSFLRGEVGG